MSDDTLRSVRLERVGPGRFVVHNVRGGSITIEGSGSEDFTPIVRYGLRSWTGTLGYLLLLRVDQVLIAPLGGARVLGIYAVAAGAAELPNTALTAVRGPILGTASDVAVLGTASDVAVKLSGSSSA